MEKLLNTKEAIEKRSSIRKFKSIDIADKTIMALLESARLVPSGCNAQPWRFKIIRDEETKKQLQALSYNQNFITQAPFVLVVCADVQAYLDGRTSSVQDLGEIGVFDNDICVILHKITYCIFTVCNSAITNAITIILLSSEKSLEREFKKYH